MFPEFNVVFPESCHGAQITRPALGAPCLSANNKEHGLQSASIPSVYEEGFQQIPQD